MTYHLELSDTATSGLQRIAKDQVNQALNEVHRRGLKKSAQVHQLRKRCKKLRGLLRLFRGSLDDTYQKENAYLRDTAALLSDSRDAKVLIDTYDLLMRHFEKQVNRQSFGSIRRKLTWQRKQMNKEEPTLDSLLDEAAKRLRKVKRRIKKWNVQGDGFDALEGGLKKTYDRARTAMDKAYEKNTPESFHQWRKRVKYHWYHMRLLSELWPQVLEARASEAHRLSDLLGEDHDLAVLDEHLQCCPTDFGKKRDVQAFSALVERRRKQLERFCRPLGERLLAEGKGCFIKRTEKYWDAWNNGAQL